jgi:hypothetical protein
VFTSCRFSDQLSCHFNHVQLTLNFIFKWNSLNSMTLMFHNTYACIQRRKRLPRAGFWHLWSMYDWRSISRRQLFSRVRLEFYISRRQLRQAKNVSWWLCFNGNRKTTAWQQFCDNRGGGQNVLKLPLAACTIPGYEINLRQCTTVNTTIWKQA